MSVIDTCSFCNKLSRTRRCGCCKTACYCSVECQRQDWNALHKYVCMAPRGKLSVVTFSRADNYAGVIANADIKRFEVLFDGPPQLYFSGVDDLGRKDSVFNPPGTIPYPREAMESKDSFDMYEWLRREAEKRIPETMKRLKQRPPVPYAKNEGHVNDTFESYIFESNLNMARPNGVVLGYVFDEFLGKINHACGDNASCHWIILPNRFILIAQRDIAQGEEITISYTFLPHVAYKFEERCFDALGFQCKCKGHGKTNMSQESADFTIIDKEVEQWRRLLLSSSSSSRQSHIYRYLLATMAMENNFEDAYDVDLTRVLMEEACHVPGVSRKLHCLHHFGSCMLKRDPDAIAKVFVDFGTWYINEVLGLENKELLDKMMQQEITAFMALFPESQVHPPPRPKK